MSLIVKTSYFIYLAMILFIVACSPDSNGFKADVGYKGALKNMMKKGDISAKSGLAEFEGMDHFYALGALENLKGEIQIFDSRPFITSEGEKEIEVDSTFNKKASLLVYATVESWQEIIVPGEVTDYTGLERYIYETAKEYNINTNHPFPFLLKGFIASLDWHIINWKDGDMEHSHEKHISSGPNGTILNQEVVILGFYSDSHHGIFTHHTTNMHMHMKTSENNLAGHVDDVQPGRNMILKLPLQKHQID